MSGFPVSPKRALARFSFLASALGIFLAAPPSIRAAETTIYLHQRGYVSGVSSPATTLTDLAVAAFERAHPEIDVVIVGLPWTKEGDLKLRASLLARRKIDCFRVTNDQLPDFIPARGELLSPADPRLTLEDRADISSGALAAVTHNGKVMAWPLWSTALLLAANSEILRERGVALPSSGAPWTWDEFTRALEQTTFTRGRDQVWGLTAAARPPLFEWSPLLWAHAGAIAGAGPKGAAGGWPELELSPALPEALVRAAELRARGWTPPSFGIDDQMAAQGQFLAGRAAFILCTPAFVRTLKDRSFEFGILPPPVGALGRPITTGALGCFAVVAHPDAPEREAAAHLLARYLTSAEIAADVPGWYLAAPARASAAAAIDDPALAALAEIARTAVYLNVPGGAAFLERALIPNLQAALIGESTPEEAVKKISAAYERMRLE